MKPRIIVIAHDLRSTHNIGSLFRTCEGIGVEKLFLTGYSPYPAQKDDKRLPHIVRKLESQIDKTALGAQKFQKWQHEADIENVLNKLSQDGYVICALEQSADSVSLDKFKVPKKVAFILGNELNGLDKDVIDKVPIILEIPMQGKKESFNVVQAAAMALYAFRFGCN